MERGGDPMARGRRPTRCSRRGAETAAQSVGTINTEGVFEGWPRLYGDRHARGTRGTRRRRQHPNPGGARRRCRHSVRAKPRSNSVAPPSAIDGGMPAAPTNDDTIDQEVLLIAAQTWCRANRPRQCRRARHDVVEQVLQRIERRHMREIDAAFAHQTRWRCW